MDFYVIRDAYDPKHLSIRMKKFYQKIMRRRHQQLESASVVIWKATSVSICHQPRVKRNELDIKVSDKVDPLIKILQPNAQQNKIAQSCL